MIYLFVKHCLVLFGVCSRISAVLSRWKLVFSLEQIKLVPAYRAIKRSNMNGRPPAHRCIPDWEQTNYREFLHTTIFSSRLQANN